MARLSRFCPPGVPQHVIQRGNNKANCFADDEDFSAYAHWLKEYSQESQVAVHAWVFMTNHVHFLVTPTTWDGVSIMMQALGRHYVRYFNSRHGRSGTLWEGRFRSGLVQSDRYLLQCYRYIELNPVRASIVDEPSGYHWSSYGCNGLGVETDLCTPHYEYSRLGKTKDDRLLAYRALFKDHVEHDLLAQIRDAVNKGLALGDDGFKTQVEALYGQRIRPATMGRPKKSVI
jgi:putative transposase